MITRIKVQGFKSLKDVEISLGPFTCIAGANAVGKSNLFDAIKLLGALATEKVIDAVKSVRSEGQRASELKDIFFTSRNVCNDRVYFEVDLIIPTSAVDELGEKAHASITSVRYCLELKLISDQGIEGISLVKEELVPINITEARRKIEFDASGEWKRAVIQGKRSIPFISTEVKGDNVVVRLHQDQEKGKPFDRNPVKMGRTVLSTVSAEFPTACIVREEIKSWVQLQLEPTALRKSDDLELSRTARLAADGSHLPATLFRLTKERPDRDIYQEMANRLNQLVEGVNEIRVDLDEKRQLLSLILRNTDGSDIPARSLSDGTLRFLALCLVEADDKTSGLICLEEPENGIHPRKIGAILELLKDIACDPTSLDDHSLRQVIINTHSPLVIQQVPDDSLLAVQVQGTTPESAFQHMNGTWRDFTETTKPMTNLSHIYAYLGSSDDVTGFIDKVSRGQMKAKKVKDRTDVRRAMEMFQ